MSGVKTYFIDTVLQMDMESVVPSNTVSVQEGYKVVFLPRQGCNQRVYVYTCMPASLYKPAPGIMTAVK